MAGDLVRPKDLPPNSTINPNARIPADDGAKVYGPTLIEAVNQARPFANQAEAEAGSNTTKAMNTKTVKQSIAYEIGRTIASASQGAKADTAIQLGDLAPVATTGDYADLTGKPALGTMAFEDTTAWTPIDQALPPGGDSDQVLSKVSAADYDAQWVTVSAVVPDDGVTEPKLNTSLTLSMAPAVTSKTALKALNTSRYTTAFLAAAGLEGMFTWQGSDVSGEMLGPVVTSTAVNSGTGTITKVAHNLTLGEAVIVTSTVNGLSTNTLYWVIRVDADNFKLATSLANARAGTAVTLTGTANFTVRQHRDPYEGAYVPKSVDITGASGAWVRPEIGTGAGKVSWFGAVSYPSKAAALAGVGSGNQINACAELFPSVDLGIGFLLVDETVRVKTFVSGVDPLPSGTHFFGRNNYDTRLVAANGLNAPVLDTNGVSSIGLSNFGIEGNGVNNTGASTLLIRNSYYGFIHEVRVLDGAASHAAIYSQGSNNITYTTVFASNCQGAGWFLDANSRHNVFTTCGAEDWNLGGATAGDAIWGWTDNGSNNYNVNTWLENRNGLATDCAYRSNNRDNTLEHVEITAGAQPFAIGIQLGASSDRCRVMNPHFGGTGGVTAPVVLLGTNKYRELVNLFTPATDVTNTNTDATSLIRRGNQIFDLAALQTITSTNGASGLRLDIYGGSTNLLRIQNAGSTAWEVAGSNHLLPGTNNASDIGNASRRVREIFAVNGTINTSDRDSKRDIGVIPDEWLDAWADVEWVRFKFKEAVTDKGEGARWHVGLVAQQVMEAFEAHGLDAFELGLLCFDEWGDEFDEDGNEIVSAGSSYGVRYSEAEAMEAAYQRRRLDRLEIAMQQRQMPIPD